MSSISESGSARTEPSLSPWHALDACHECQRLLDDYFRWGASAYSPPKDQTYRALRHIVLALVKREPCFERVNVPEDLLPPVLSHHKDETWWNFVGEQQILRFQSVLLTALTAAGIERAPSLRQLLKSNSSSGSDTPERAEEMAGAQSGTRATRKRASRQSRALALQAEGKTVKEIAIELGVTQRSVFNYLGQTEA